MKTYHITFIGRETKVSPKTNKPYERISLKVSEYGNRFLSGFGSQVTQNWKMGDDVELTVSEVANPKGGMSYLNFEYAKPDSLADRVKRIEITVQQLEPMFREWKEKNSKVGSTNIPYPTEPQGQPNFDTQDDPWNQ